MLDKKTTCNGLIQAMTISKNPALQLTFTYLIPDPYGFDNNSINFVKEEPQAELDSDEV